MATTELIMAAAGASTSVGWITFLGAGTGTASEAQFAFGAVDSSGNVSVCTWKYGQKAMFYKLLSTGTVTSQFSLGTTGKVIGLYGIGCDSSNNTYIAGDSTAYNATYNSGFIAKINTSNTLDWQKYNFFTSVIQYNNSNPAITINQSGNILIADSSTNAGTGVFSITSTPTVSTSDIVGGKINYIINLGSNLYGLAGRMNTSSNASAKFVKYNQATRTVAWAKSYYAYLPGEQNPGGDFVGGGTDSSGNIYVGGTYANGRFPQVTKLSSTGTLVWAKQVGVLYEGITDTKVDSSNYIYATGNTDSYSPGTIWQLVKFDTSGTVIWKKAISFDISFSRIRLTSLDVSDATNIYLFGNNDVDGTGVVLKLPKSGNCNGSYVVKLNGVSNATLTIANYNGSVTDITSSVNVNNETVTPTSNTTTLANGTETRTVTAVVTNNTQLTV